MKKQHRLGKENSRQTVSFTARVMVPGGGMSPGFLCRGRAGASQGGGHGHKGPNHEALDAGSSRRGQEPEGAGHRGSRDGEGWAAGERGLGRGSWRGSGGSFLLKGKGPSAYVGNPGDAATVLLSRSFSCHREGQAKRVTGPHDKAVSVDREEGADQRGEQCGLGTEEGRS